MEEQCDPIYRLIESFKNGCIFSAKYENHIKVFNVRFIVAFANFRPDLTNLDNFCGSHKTDKVSYLQIAEKLFDCV